MEDEFDKPVDDIRDQLTILYQKINASGNAPSDAINEAMGALSVLVEELRQADHQIKLNYEELLQTRQTLEEERARYRELFEFVPDAYLVTDTFGTIQEANQAAAAMLNVRADFLIKKPLRVFVENHAWQQVYYAINQLKPASEFELPIQPRGKQSIISSVKMTVVRNAQYEPEAVRWVLRDITEQKKAQAALASSEARFRTIFQGADIGIVLTQLDSTVIEANTVFSKMLGYSSGDLKAKNLASFSESNETSLLSGVNQTLFEKQQEHFRAEHKFLSQNGAVLWARLIVTILKDEEQQPQYLLYMIENITDEKQTAEELFEMKRRLQISSEIERLYLARDIHDGPMQDLYGAVFHLSMLGSMSDNEEVRKSVQDVQGILKGVANTLRAICGELRPPTLENLGVERAIRAHAEKLQERYPDLQIQMNLQRDEQELPTDVRLALFRIYQQAMNNVILHSQATQVEVNLSLLADQVLLSIRDNGIGFTQPDKWLDLLREGHYGLAGMAERVEIIGGVMNIASDQGQGTFIQVNVPR